MGRAVLAWAPILLAAVLYSRTFSPWVLPGDSAELVTAAVTLGVCHPTGYPLYLVVAKVATLCLFPLPPQVVINGLSTVCALITLAVVVRSMQALGLGPIPSACSVSLLAVAPSLWRYSTHAEVYTLHGLLMSLVLLVALHPHPRPGSRRLVAYLAGLSTGSHMTTVLAYPGLLLWLALRPRTPGERERPADLAALAGSFLLGCTVLLLFFVMDRPDRLNVLQGMEVWRPDLHLDAPWRRFLYVVSASQFKAASGFLPGLLTWRFFGNAYRVLAGLFADSGLLLVLGCIGLCLPFSNQRDLDRPRRALLGAMMIVWPAYLATYVRFFQPVFFLPVHIVLSIGTASLLHRVLRWRPTRMVAALLLTSILGLRLRSEYHAMDVSRDSDFQLKTARLLAHMEPEAVVFSTWTCTTMFWFHQWVGHVNPRVEVVNALQHEWLVRAPAYRGRPLYFEKVPPGARPEDFAHFGWFYKLESARR